MHGLTGKNLILNGNASRFILANHADNAADLTSIIVAVIGVAFVAGIIFGIVALLLYLGNRVEKSLGVNRTTAEEPLDPKRTKYSWILMASLMALVFAFGFGRGLVQRFYPPNENGRLNAQAIQGSQTTSDQKRDATLAYWQTAVANLHVVRFETPSGQESAEQYYERLIQQIRQKRDSARAMSTANVDVDLVQMAQRHLEVEDLFIDYKQQVDEYMKNEKLARPADTIEQRMALSQLILSSIQAAPNALNNMPAGPIRDLIEKGVILEQSRQMQLREIEIMQAVLQERYRGTKFPLPTVAN